MTTAPNWSRLASYVISARVTAGYKDRRAFAAAIGVTERTLGKLENGQHVSTDTLAVVEHAVGWKPDSARSILYGGEPATIAPASGGRPPELRYDDRVMDAIAKQVWEINHAAGDPLSIDVLKAAVQFKWLERQRDMDERNGERAAAAG